jgi:hypothetical protein
MNKRFQRGLTGPGKRMPEPGNDVDLGPYEARLRDTYGLTPFVGEADIRSLDPPQLTEDTEVEKASKKLAWASLLPPKLDWIYRESITRGSSIIATATQFEIFSELVPKAQALVVLEFTPLLFQDDPSTPGLFIEMDRFQHLGRIYAELNSSARSPLRADARVQDLEGGTSGGTPIPSARGTGIMNERAFTSDPTFPMGLYIPSDSRLTVTFRLFDTAGAAQQLQNMAGGGTTLAFGCKILGFFITNKEADYITGSRR